MRCTLYGFITDYVKDIFIEEILFDIREKLTEVTLGKMKCQDNRDAVLWSSPSFAHERDITCT